MRAQLANYGIAPISGAVDKVERLPGGGFRVTAGEASFAAPHVIFASGVRDRLPPAPEAVEQVRRGIIRQCPVCDAFEMTGKRVGVVGSGMSAAGEALFLRGYTPDVTLIPLGGPFDLPPHEIERLDEAEIKRLDATLDRLEVEDDEDIAEGARPIRAVLSDGRRLEFDGVYSGLGVTPHVELAAALGVELSSGRAHRHRRPPALLGGGRLRRGRRGDGPQPARGRHGPGRDRGRGHPQRPAPRRAALPRRPGMTPGEPAALRVPKVALVLSGGVGLGAYQAGAFRALEARFAPGHIAAASIGAVNGAIVAGNAPGRRADALDAFWNAVATTFPAPFPGAGEDFAHDQPWRRAASWAGVIQSRLAGRPGLFSPQVPATLLGGERLGLYTLAPLARMLERFVDFGASTRAKSASRSSPPTSPPASRSSSTPGAARPSGRARPRELRLRPGVRADRDRRAPPRRRRARRPTRRWRRPSTDLGPDEDVICFVLDLFARDVGPPRTLAEAGACAATCCSATRPTAPSTPCAARTPCAGGWRRRAAGRPPPRRGAAPRRSCT
jgi:hypothetical protein